MTYLNKNLIIKSLLVSSLFIPINCNISSANNVLDATRHHQIKQKQIVNLDISNTENTSVKDITNLSVIQNFGGNNDDYFASSKLTKDGGLIVVGDSGSIDASFENKGASDGIIIKYDKYGKQKWIKSYGGSDYDTLNDVIELSDGSFVAVGETWSSDAGYENKGQADIAIIKYSKNGNQEWFKTISGLYREFVNTVIELNDGSIIVSGSTQSKNLGIPNSNGYTRVFSAKFNKNGEQEWIKTYNDSMVGDINSSKKTSDGGYILVGNSTYSGSAFTSNGSQDAIIIKCDANGEQEWVKNFGGSYYDYFNDVVEDKDGNFVAVGEFASTNTEFENKGEEDSVIIKYDKDGNRLWAKSLGVEQSDVFISIDTTKDGGYIVSRRIHIDGGAHDWKYNTEIIKYSKDGDILWIKKFGDHNDYFNTIISTGNDDFIGIGTSSSTDIGYKNKGFEDGIIVKYNTTIKEQEQLFQDIYDININKNSDDFYFDIIKTLDGGYLTVGGSKSWDIGLKNKGASDGIIVKYDKNMNQEWINSFGGSKDDEFYSCIEVDDGYIAIGKSNSIDAGFDNGGGNDAIIVKYTKKGEFKWVKSLSGNYDDNFDGIINTDDGGFIVNGWSESTDIGFANDWFIAIFAKYNSNGEQEWLKTFNPQGYDASSFRSLSSTSDGGFISSGYTYLENEYYPDGLIVKYSEGGEQEWMTVLQGNYDEYLYAIEETPEGDFIAVGETYSTDISSDYKGRYDGLIAKYSKDGSNIWTKTFGGTGDDWFNSVTVDSNGDYIALGRSNSMDAEFNNKGDYDILAVKYDSNGNRLWVKNFGGSMNDNVYSVINDYDGGFIGVGYSYSADAGFKHSGKKDAIIIKHDSEGNQEFIKTIDIKPSVNIGGLESIRDRVNKLPAGEMKNYLDMRIDMIKFAFGGLEPKSSSAALDIYIKAENMLSMSLNTNSVTFENYSGIEDIIKNGAVTIAINSSLPYSLNAYMPNKIENADKSKEMDLSIFNIKESSESDYEQFENYTDKVVLKGMCEKGNGKVHSIDMKLSSNNAHQADIYKTVIRFEAEQK